MKLRTSLDLFSAALLSALGASSLVACGGSFNGGPGGSAGSGNSPGAGAGGASQGGASPGGASQGGASQGGAGQGGSSGGVNHYPCKNPKDIGNGVIQCDGFTHRPEATTCSSQLPRPEPFPNAPPNAQCKMDADCTEKPNGWCGFAGVGEIPGPFCNYGCLNDSECGADQICLCGDPVGRCVQTSGCKTDTACPPGFLCRSFDSSGGCQLTTFTCQAPADECGSDADCSAKQPGTLCLFSDEVRHFRCEQGGCAIGRPFLVEGEQRLAPVAVRADWRELAVMPRVAELDAAVAAHLAERWTRVALMEHASIAAFARFSLQLMSLGAPSDLVELTTAAMADETKHAKACFAVASAYADAPIGPGRLAVERSLDEMSLEQIVLNTIREGCVGETVAAIEAREAAEHASTPALRALLVMISEDETRHAELAFRFVKWALSQGDAALEHAARREFDALAGEANGAFEALSALEGETLRHGIVPEPMRRVVRARAISEVILPCSHALFATRARSTGTDMAFTSV